MSNHLIACFIRIQQSTVELEVDEAGDRVRYGSVIKKRVKCPQLRDRGNAINRVCLISKFRVFTGQWELELDSGMKSIGGADRVEHPTPRYSFSPRSDYTE